MIEFIATNWYWQLFDGTVWSTAAADFVSQETALAWAQANGMNAVPVSPFDENGIASQAGLIAALEFYGLPLGALETDNAARAAALEALRLRKWQTKDAGITVNGIQIDTDDRGQATISGAVLNCLRNPNWTTQWKTAAVNPDGTAVWMTVGATEVNAIADAMTGYTEACFTVEAAKQAEVAALTGTAAIQGWQATMLDIGWPSQVVG
jgi:hypothetical protein